MRTHVFLLSFLLVFLFSCQNDLSSDLEIITDENLVSVDMAEKIALSYLSEGVMVKTKADAQISQKVVEDRFSLLAQDAKPYMHIINFKNGGFILVSADNRLQPILGYSDEGYFDNNQSNYPGGLLDWLYSFEETVLYLRENNEQLPVEIKALWDKYDPSIVCTKGEVPPPEEACINLINISVGPLLTTKWHQSSPFNELLPTISCTPNGHGYVGCVPLAIAQTLKFHKSPTTYQWNQMPDNGASSYTKELIKAVNSSIGYANITYDCNGTSMDLVGFLGIGAYDVGRLFRNSFGYSNAVQDGYDYAVVKSELLTHRRPVIISGHYPHNLGFNGHAWVCDGAHYYEACSENGQNIYGFLYFHHNMGWQDYTYNAWYAYNNFNIGGHNYDRHMRMIYKIIP